MVSVLAGEPIDSRQNSLRHRGFRIDGESLLSFLGGFGVVVVFQRQTGEQFLRFEQLGVPFECLLRQFFGVAGELVGGNQGQAKLGVGVVGFDLEGFGEQVGGVLVIVHRRIGAMGAVLQEHAAPAHTVLRIVGMLGYQIAEGRVGITEIALLPIRFRLLEGLGRKNQGNQKQHGAEPRGLSHLSISSVILPSSSSRRVICFL